MKKQKCFDNMDKNKKIKTQDWALDYFKKMEVEIRYFIVFRIINT